MIKVYAVADDVPEDVKSYITAGREYRVHEVGGRGFYIQVDDGGETLCLWEGCSHLNDGSWRRVEREE